tara:strand:- start:36 stop:485 length:450 start_codon:yes stop_codon:yes gene_type:complete
MNSTVYLIIFTLFLFILIKYNTNSVNEEFSTQNNWDIEKGPFVSDTLYIFLYSDDLDETSQSLSVYVNRLNTVKQKFKNSFFSGISNGSVKRIGKYHVLSWREKPNKIVDSTTGKVGYYTKLTIDNFRKDRDSIYIKQKQYPGRGSLSL